MVNRDAVFIFLELIGLLVLEMLRRNNKNTELVKYKISDNSCYIQEQLENIDDKSDEIKDLLQKLIENTGGSAI